VIIFLITASYLLGSIPFGWLLPKILIGVDLRQEGSGATGGTNAFRVLQARLGFRRGLLLAIIAGIADVSKAYLPTKLAVKLWPNKHWLHIFVASAATFGHTKSVFIGFKGGKAVSTTAGSFFAIANREPKLWHVLELSIGAFVGTIVGTKGIVSLGSLIGSVTGAFYSTRLSVQKKISRWYSLWIAFTAIYIWVLHWPNVKRMAKRQEPRTLEEIFIKLEGLVVNCWRKIRN